MTRAEFHKLWTEQVRALSKTLRERECLYYAEFVKAREGFGVKVKVRIVVDRSGGAQGVLDYLVPNDTEGYSRGH